MKEEQFDDEQMDLDYFRLAVATRQNPTYNSTQSTSGSPIPTLSLKLN